MHTTSFLRATRSVLLSPQPLAFSLSLSLLSLATLPSPLSLSLFLFLPQYGAFTLSLPTAFPHSRHSISDTRYLIMLNASGFCSRIMRPRCPRTLFRFPTVLILSLSFTRVSQSLFVHKSLLFSLLVKKELSLMEQARTSTGSGRTNLYMMDVCHRKRLREPSGDDKRGRYFFGAEYSLGTTIL